MSDRTFYDCPECGHSVSTTATTAGAFGLRPNIRCEECDVRMTHAATVEGVGES